MEKQVRKWERAVDYSCQHALRAAGYEKPTDIRKAKVADLLCVAGADANNVASLLSYFYGEDNKWRSKINHRPNFNITKAELASDIQDIYDYYGFDAYPDQLQEITVEDFLELDGIDEVTIPSMVRKIKHLIYGTPEPFDLSPMPLKSSRKKSVAVCDEPSELSWDDQDSLRDEDYGDDSYYGMGEYQPPEYYGGLAHAW